MEDHTAECARPSDLPATLELGARRKFERGYPRVELESAIDRIVLVDIPEGALIDRINR